MTDLKKLKSDIKKWSVELGFDQMGVSGIEVKKRLGKTDSMAQK